MIELGFLLLLCTGALAAKPGDSCPEAKGVENFNLTQFGGPWNIILRYDPTPDMDSKCITAEYKENSDGSVEAVLDKVSIKTGKAVTLKAKLDFIGKRTVAEFRVTLQNGITQPHIILDTDYDNYAVGFVCQNQSTVLLRIFSRKQDLAAGYLEKVYKILDEYKISKADLEVTKYDNCPSKSKKQ